MTITLTSATESRLREKAEREGRDVNAVADTLISTALELELGEVAAIEEGLLAGDEGRERALDLFLAEHRAKFSPA